MIILLKKKIFFASLVCLTFLINAYSQDTSLDKKYNEMMENSETYEVYKVIRETRLNAFWSEVMDTLNYQQSLISEATNSIGELESAIENQQTEIDQLKSDLGASNAMNESISFFGITFSKTVYHIIVWAIIIGLAIITGIVFGMFKRSNVVTTRTIKDYRELTAEYDAFRDKSRENYVKLKRELQTAINKLEEQKKNRRSGVGEVS